MVPYDIQARTFTEQDTAVKYATVPVAEFGPWLQTALWDVAVYLERKGAGPAGMPFARHHRTADGLVEIEAGFPATTPTNGEGEVEPSDLPGGVAAVTVHVGPYDPIEPASCALETWIRRHGGEPQGDAWEVYFSDPSLNHDLATWRTEVVQPYRPMAGSADGGRREREARVDTGELYERTRREFVTTILAVSVEELEVRVPATPDWSVRDVLAHVVGLAADLNAERFPAPDDPGGTAWTASQVQRGRRQTREGLLAEWDRQAPTFEDGLRVFGYEMGSHFVADLHAHYQDVRGALGLPGVADELTVRVALDHYLAFLDELLSDAGWGTLDLMIGDEPCHLGAVGQHQATLRVQPFELLRWVSGRRSAPQIRALEWEGDVDDLLLLLHESLTGGYAMPVADLIE